MAEQYSKACCTTPAAIVGEYAVKGTWTEVNGIKTYVTGDPTATKAIIHLYDVFGYCPQTFQGADILSTQGKEPYLVFMPDFIGSDRAAKHEWFLPGADKAPMQELVKFVTSGEMMASIHDAVSTLRSDSKYGHIQRWAGVGFCWGSKGISLIAAEGERSLLDVTAHSSPSRLDPNEAKTITVPTIMLPSQGEDEELVTSYVDNLKGEKDSVRFDEVHGWMSARAKLDEERTKKAYERGYQVILDWLAKYL